MHFASSTRQPSAKTRTVSSDQIVIASFILIVVPYHLLGQRFRAFWNGATYARSANKNAAFSKIGQSKQPFRVVEVVEHHNDITAGLVNSAHHSPERDYTTLYVLYASMIQSAGQLVKEYD